jgi:hypothetical protein
MTGVERALLRECPLEPIESEKARLWLRNEACEAERAVGVRVVSCWSLVVGGVVAAASSISDDVGLSRFV